MSFNVYLLIGEDDKPIYIGRSANVKKRVETHLRDGTTYAALDGRTKHQAAQRIETVRCASYENMTITERQLITEHRPVLNITDNTDHIVYQRDPRYAEHPTPRHGLPWLPEEDATVLRGDIFVCEPARLLGRSYKAAIGRRQTLARKADAAELKAKRDKPTGGDS
jgi:predicted GIY-YIG superfamily endonuclease